MKHSLKVTLILIVMFFIAQLIGIYVANAYLPSTLQVKNETTGEYENVSVYEIPYGFNPPSGLDPKTTVVSIIIALAAAVIIMLLLMRIHAATFLRIWFFIVVTIGIALAANAFLKNISSYAQIIAIVIALPLAFLKIFKRDMLAHNFTELLIYPGIASVFIPLLSIWTVVILLLLISVYDIYAVWHAGFMQKMAKYQIEKLRIFSGFFIPYMRKQDRLAFEKAKKSGKDKRVKVSVAILGGGDVVFPIILAGVVLSAWGIFPALIVSLGATLALATLFYFSEKGKFYPAMPFISAGCFIALAIAYVIF